MTITAVRPKAPNRPVIPAQRSRARKPAAPRVDFDDLVREQRFEMLVRDHQRSAVWILYGQCGNWADAEEAVQDALLKLWAQRQRLDGVTDPAPWLYTEAKWALRHIWNKKAATCPALLGEHIGRVEDQQHEPSSGPCLGEPETMERVRRALATLPPDVRRVVDLHCVQGLPLTEVMARTGKKRHAVHQLLYKAYRQHTGWSGPEWRDAAAGAPEAEALRTRVSLLAKLSPRVREAAWLRYVDGLPLNEVGARMHISAKQVSNLLNDARRVARAELAESEA